MENNFISPTKQSISRICQNDGNSTLAEWKRTNVTAEKKTVVGTMGGFQLILW